MTGFTTELTFFRTGFVPSPVHTRICSVPAIPRVLGRFVYARLVSQAFAPSSSSTQSRNASSRTSSTERIQAGAWARGPRAHRARRARTCAARRLRTRRENGPRPGSFVHDDRDIKKSLKVACLIGNKETQLSKHTADSALAVTEATVASRPQAT